ncbi:DUF6894 family protein [Methylorubrum rhodesianum]|uniref:DUF6894 family protein n=1 Tax=Methylorubrum rhodesianum TaxID=29427 RepID=UPI003D2BDB89
MPRYFFHIDEIRHHTDTNGVELADLEAARKEAEPRRDFRRLQLLREWSHDEAYPTLSP